MIPIINARYVPPSDTATTQGIVVAADHLISTLPFDRLAFLIIIIAFLLGLYIIRKTKPPIMTAAAAAKPCPPPALPQQPAKANGTAHEVAQEVAREMESHEAINRIENHIKELRDEMLPKILKLIAKEAANAARLEILSKREEIITATLTKLTEREAQNSIMLKQIIETQKTPRRRTAKKKT